MQHSKFSRVFGLGAVALLLALSMPAYATGNGVSNDCPGNSCKGGNGGNGGAGGNGGSATGVGVGVGIAYSNATGGNSSATGGSVVGSGNSSNHNTNTNANLNTNTVKNTNTNAQGQQQGQQQGQLQGQAQSTENSGNNTGTSNVNVGGDTYEARRIPVSTAYANAPLPSATCRTGGAVGIQVMGFGGSFGGDRAVDTCEINEAARIAAAIGKTDMATEIFCQNKWAKKTTECKAIAVEE